MKRLALGILTAGLVLAPAVAAPASPARGHRPAGSAAGCITQSLEVHPLSGQTLVETVVTNDCGVPVALRIRYRAFGPCPHRGTVEITVQPGWWSVATFYRGPCPGAYTLDQRVVAGADLVGTDSTTFVAT